MSYIWENYDSNNYYTIADKFFSPYVEVLDNQGTAYLSKRKNIEVNCIRRFSMIFEEILEDDIEIQKYKDIINVFFHFLAILDLNSGLTFTEFRMCLLLDEIMEGAYGQKIKTSILMLDTKHLFLILRYLIFYDDGLNKDDYFYEIIANSLDVGECRYQPEEKTWLLHIKEEENEYTKNYVALCSEFFLELGCCYEIYWKYPFGIIGYPSNMEIENMRIV